ncbi:transporter substrate-binding domain-containing protein [Neiella sp. HB171785]|uniref:Transporter substrate-binding domain-containing protein n=1 Tax=Neiella litorisoli TaxID=2771431 RepID=A0A8J6UDV6_9GAMM|nr:transporter substrate-binding domain-containing protein [Neiella litorisoli]MBD1388619.1 transporter substrate-binding domain-containing protein [Neiella litorisoli]
MARLVPLILCLLLVTPASATIKLLVYDYPPLVQINRQAKPTGHAIDLVTPLFLQAGVQYQFVKLPLKRAIQQAAQHKNTCTFPVFRTQRREADFRWIGPISVNRFGLYSLAENNHQLVTLNDAKAHKIGVYAGSAVANYLTDNGFSTYETSSIAQGLQMLKHGRIEFWVADIQSIQQASSLVGEQQLTPSLSFYTSMSFMACNLSSDAQDLDALEAQLKTMYLTGQAQQLLHLSF